MHYFVFLSCSGKIVPPSDGTVLNFLPGSSVNITWDFDDEISQVASRSWSFTSSDGLRSGALGVIVFNSQPQIRKNVLPGVDIMKPATLVLNNVDYSFDGTYTFTITAVESDTSNVIVFIASKFYS